MKSQLYKILIKLESVKSKFEILIYFIIWRCMKLYYRKQVQITFIKSKWNHNYLIMFINNYDFNLNFIIMIEFVLDCNQSEVSCYFKW